MSTTTAIAAHADFVSVELNIEAPDVMAIGGKMQEMNPEAYMNGYNWDAFIDHYLKVRHDFMLTGKQSDPEAGAYLALYPNDELGNKMALKLGQLLNHLIAKPELIYAFMEEEGDGVEWD